MKKNKFVINTFWMLIEKGTTVLGGLFVSVYIARYLGPKDLGLINFYLALVSLITPISQLGVPTLVFDKAANNPKLGVKIIKTSVLYRNILFLVMSALVVIYAYLKSGDDYELLIACGMLLAAYFSAMNVYRTYFDASFLSKYNAVATQIGLVLSHISRLLFVQLSLGVTYFTLSFVVNSLVPYLIVKRKFNLVNKTFKVRKVTDNYKRAFFKAAFPLSLVAFSTIIYVKINQVMLGLYFSTVEVGLYSAAILLAQGWAAINTIFVTSILTKVLREKVLNNKLEGFSFIFLFTSVISVFFSIFIFYFGEFLMQKLFGSSFEIERWLLLILSLSSLFSAWGLLVNRIIINYGGYKFILLKTVVLGVSSVLMSSLLVKEFGMYGAAITTLITEVLGSTILAYLFSKVKIARIQYGMLTSYKYVSRLI